MQVDCGTMVAQEWAVGAADRCKVESGPLMVDVGSQLGENAVGVGVMGVSCGPGGSGGDGACLCSAAMDNL